MGSYQKHHMKVLLEIITNKQQFTQKSMLYVIVPVEVLNVKTQQHILPLSHV
jgi:hypothetical protein